jgi:hypothetical protein
MTIGKELSISKLMIDYHGKFAEGLRAVRYRAMGKVPSRESEFANLDRLGRLLKSG